MNIEIGNTYKGICVHFDYKGAIFELEDQTTAYVHISKIANSFVKNIGDFIDIGDTYELKCIESTINGNGFEFSLLHLNLQNRYNQKPDKFKNNTRSLNITNQDKLESMIQDMNTVYEDKRSLINKRNKRRK